jgi:hypothetical protein
MRNTIRMEFWFQFSQICSGLLKKARESKQFGRDHEKVVDRQITEAESIVSCNVNKKNLENLKKPLPAMSQPLAPSERVSCDELIRISDLCFDAIEQNNSEMVPWDPECYPSSVKIEPCVLVRNSPLKPYCFAKPGFISKIPGCAQQRRRWTDNLDPLVRDRVRETLLPANSTAWRVRAIVD